MEKDLMELVEGCGLAKPTNDKRIPEATETAKLLEELGFKAAASAVSQKLYPILKSAKIAAGKYVEITPDKINAYLQRKAARYDEAREAKRSKHKPVDTDVNVLTIDSWSRLLMEQQQRTGTGLISQATFTTGTSLPGTIEWGSVQNQGLWKESVTFSEIGTFDVPTIHHGNTEIYSAYTKGGDVNRFQWEEVTVERYAGIPPTKVLLKFKAEKEKQVFDYFTIASVNAVRDPLLLGRIESSDKRWFIAQWGDDVALDEII